MNDVWLNPQYTLTTIGTNFMSNCSSLSMPDASTYISSMQISYSIAGVSRIAVQNSAGQSIAVGTQKTNDFITNWWDDPSNPNIIIGFEAFVYNDVIKKIGVVLLETSCTWIPYVEPSTATN